MLDDFRMLRPLVARLLRPWDDHQQRRCCRPDAAAAQGSKDGRDMAQVAGKRSGGHHQNVHFLQHQHTTPSDRREGSQVVAYQLVPQ